MPDFCLRQNPSDLETPEDDPEWVANGCEGVIDELSPESADPEPGGVSHRHPIRCGGCNLPILYEPDGDPVRFIDEVSLDHGSALVRAGPTRFLITRVTLSPDTDNHGQWVREGADVYAVFGAFLKENIGGAYAIRSETGNEAAFIILDINQRENGKRSAVVSTPMSPKTGSTLRTS